MLRVAQSIPLAVVLVALCGCNQSRVAIGTVHFRQERTSPVTQAGVMLDSGQVAIRPSDDGAIVVEAEVLVRKERAGEFLGETLEFAEHVAIEESDSGAVTFRSAHEGHADGDDWELRMTIRLPSEPELRIKVDAGSVSVKLPVVASLSVDVDAGQVDAEFETVRGATTVKVDAGQIRLMARDAVGSIRASVNAGQIDVSLPPSFSGRLDAKASVGDIDIATRLGIAVQHDIATQSASGDVGQGGDASVVLRVDAGQISVR